MELLPVKGLGSRELVRTFSQKAILVSDKAKHFVAWVPLTVLGLNFIEL